MAVLDSGAVGLMALDRAGMLVDANGRFLELVGMAPSEAAGDGWMARVALPAGDGFAVRWQRMVRSGTPAGLECWLSGGVDGPVRPCLLQVTAAAEGDGLTGTVTDLSGLRWSQSELSARRRQQAVQMLGRGLGHDLKNVYMAARISHSMARKALPDQERVTPLLSDAAMALAEAERKTLGFLEFATDRVVPGEELAAAGGLAARLAEMAGAGAPLRMEVTLSDAAAGVQVDRRLAGQALLELLVEARLAMPEGGVVTVGGTAADGWLELTVTDQGAVPAAAPLGRLFEAAGPGRSGRGGEGLALCRMAAASLGGTVTAEAAEEGGVRFRLRVPCCPPVRAARAEAIRKVAGEPRVLVVDDDGRFADAVRMMLGHVGCRGEAVTDGDSALARYRQALAVGDRFRAVILDCVMQSGPEGQETAARLLAIDPEACLVVSSGYQTRDAMVRYREFGFAARLPKPYTTEALARTLREVLGDG